MLRPVDELAALVRAGELSARELVDASLARIDALQPQVNAFVDVDHEGARAAAAAIGAGDERPFAGVPIAIKNNRARRAALRLTRGAALSGDFRRRARPQRHAPPARGRLRHRRHDDACPSGASCPSPRRAASARRATRGTSRARPAARRAARRRPSPPGWCRSPTATTAAARCGSRPPAAASSASSPSAGASRWRPTSASSSSSQDGVLTRTRARDRAAARRARRARARRRVVGAAAARAVRRQRRRASRGRAADRASRRSCRCSRPSCDPACERAARDAGAPARAPRPRGRGGRSRRGAQPGMLELFTARVRSGDLRRRSRPPALLAGREPREEDMEPLSWALWRACNGDRRGPGRARRATSCRRFARAIIDVGGALRRDPDARRSRSRRCRSATLDPCGPDPARHVRALRPLHALHGDQQRHRLAGDLAAAVRSTTTACRSPSSSSAARRRRARCSRSRRRSRRRRRGRAASRRRVAESRSSGRPAPRPSRAA